MNKFHLTKGEQVGLVLLSWYIGLTFIYGVLDYQINVHVMRFFHISEVLDNFWTFLALICFVVTFGWWCISLCKFMSKIALWFVPDEPTLFSFPQETPGISENTNTAISTEVIYAEPEGIPAGTTWPQTDMFTIEGRGTVTQSERERREILAFDYAKRDADTIYLPHAQRALSLSEAFWAEYAAFALARKRYYLDNEWSGLDLHTWHHHWQERHRKDYAVREAHNNLLQQGWELPPLPIQQKG